MNYYILNEDKTFTMLADGEYPKEEVFTDPRIALNVIGNQRISTVFLHFDHGLNFGQSDKIHPPVLFESMIFEGPHDQYQRRYHTYDEALEGHNNLVKALEEERHPDFYFND